MNGIRQLLCRMDYLVKSNEAFTGKLIDDAKVRIILDVVKNRCWFRVFASFSFRPGL